MMDFDWLKFSRLAGAGLASICTFLFGAPDIWLLTLLAFIVIDYIDIEEDYVFLRGRGRALR